jgi:hypothetical protein
LLFALDASQTVTEAEWCPLAGAFARAALPYAGNAREVCEATIAVAERFARGEATRAELAAPARAAGAAVWAAFAGAWAAGAAARVEQCRIIRAAFPEHRLPE